MSAQSLVIGIPFVLTLIFLTSYFASRPEIFGQTGNASDEHEYSTNPTANQAASTVHRALAANPEATANLISAGLRHGASVHGNASGQGKVATRDAASPFVSAVRF